MTNCGKLSAMCGRLTNATRGASATKCTGAYGFFLNEAKKYFLSVLPGRVADETTLHRDEKEDVIVSRHLGRGGITVITSGFDSVAAAMRRVLEAYDAAATPVVLWPRERHSPCGVARPEGRTRRSSLEDRAVLAHHVSACSIFLWALSRWLPASDCRSTCFDGMHVALRKPLS